ncbi:hypothetical protein ACFFRL_10795 [Agromyces hippuratus]|uniref:hypothetical protein n=1 Tax=Agromyces hippuratus TaxID=286438 RepID=UPI0035E74732
MDASPARRTDQCAASSQFAPRPICTSSGTSSSAAFAMRSRTSVSSVSDSPAATSKMSSSCTVSSMRLAMPCAARSFSTRAIAILMMSAAEPWIGEFSAARSAFSRSTRFGLLRSGKGRRRPKIVSV